MISLPLSLVCSHIIFGNRLEEQKSADNSQHAAVNTEDVADGDVKEALFPPTTHQMYSYQSIDRDIPKPFLHHILSMSFHVPQDNRIAQQVFS